LSLLHVEGSVFGTISLGFLFVYEIPLGNHWMDLCQIHTEEVFGPLLGWVWRSKVKVIRDKKWHFLALSAAWVQFVWYLVNLFMAALC